MSDVLFVLYKGGRMLLGTTGPKYRPRKRHYAFRTELTAKQQAASLGADEIRVFYAGEPVTPSERV